MKISKLYTRLFSAAAVLLGAVTVAQTQDSNCDDECRSQVAQARAATAKYHEVGNALADGFRAAEACVQAPTGAMGFHFVNPPRVQSPSVNAGEPGVLLYLPDEAGEMRLVAVEYFAPVIVTGVGPWLGPGAPPAGQYDPPPVLFGRSFDGPMPGHEPGMPWHYDLHAWIWRHNPTGMFAPFNPAVSCP